MKKLCFLLLISIYSCAINATELADKKEFIKISISKECRSAFYGPPLAFIGEKKFKPPKYELWDTSTPKAISFKDDRSSVMFYVESDGRHMAAIDPSGKLLWVRNPFEESKECPYRTPRPIIQKLESIEVSKEIADIYKNQNFNMRHDFIRVTFDSSQFGLLDVETGDYFVEGQN